MPTYYVKLKDTDGVMHVNADENPDHSHRNVLIFKRGGKEVGRFVADEVVAWWCNEEDTEEVSTVV